MNTTAPAGNPELRGCQEIGSALASLAHTLGIQSSSNLPGESRLGRRKLAPHCAGLESPRGLREPTQQLWACDAIAALGGVFQLHRKQ